MLDEEKRVLTDYEKSINALIPAAEKEATRKVAIWEEKNEPRIGADGKNFNWDFWTEFFHRAMNRMAIKAGLRYVP